MMYDRLLTMEIVCMNVYFGVLLICYGMDTCFMKYMDMLYGQGHKYAKYEMEIVLHCIWLIKGCQLCILVTNIMDMDMDMGCVLPSGNATYFILMNLRVILLQGQWAIDRLGAPRSFFPRAVN